jgi:hypothetical protein
VDIYFEDLKSHRSEFILNDLYIPSNLKGKPASKPITDQDELSDEKLLGILDQYNRKVNETSRIQNISWNLFLFKKGTLATSNIVINVDGEVIELRK